MRDVGIILLAAGGSKRMGQPKQLLRLNGQSLLSRAAQAATDSGCRPILVVLGAHAEQASLQLREFTVGMLTNKEWEKGIGTSIRLAVEHILNNYHSLADLVIMLADQPAVSADVINRLIAAHERVGKPVTVSTYADTLGPPVVVNCELFPLLLSIPDDRGAKALWLNNPDEVHQEPCPEAALDVDTPEDYAKLIGSTPNENNACRESIAT